ncbi:uncharacterized protein LOC121908328 [Thunnus maccoyii]|uniref:uncharacterized protein LOC121908328 n=1 Tax=Thunnus maccoyii TaxID=8240 RepID=UPI001C4AEA24|nr:uncharacterized protein LOC121908328 [Thunnus maccoyii]XP_042284179.1 uncharacterized protein LOC121908328 [Thunnus maccoyii]
MPEGGWGSSPLPPDVCLATGFYPKTAEMVLNVKNEPAVKLDTSKAVMSKNQKGYFFAGFTNKTLLSCEMKGKTSTIGSSSNKTSPADKSSPANNTSSSNNDTSIYHQSTNNCNLDLCKDVHPEKARLNFFLLVMNGVRVIFTKTVAFSTLLTIRAMIF